MTVLFGAQHGARRVETTTDLTRMCLIVFVISIYCFGLIVTRHNAVLLALKVVALDLRASVCHTLLTAGICCFSVYRLGGLG